MELTNAQELARRLTILNKKKVPKISKSELRTGGMQGRLRRRDVKRFDREIKSQKQQIHDKLDLLESQDDFRTSSLIENFEPRIEPVLSPFNEPKLKRIRNRRGFF